MSIKFTTIGKVEHKPEEWDDRQSRIQGWDRNAIRNANILVIGAGAIANEAVKNLALLGFGHITVADFDTIELTNLTRTVLFDKSDIGKRKAPTAAKRFLQMNMEPTATADTFEGDVVYELGDGVFRRADVVLGCLDNLETRFAVNHACMRYNIPYIDAGISSLDWTLKVMKGHDFGCFECFGGNALGESRFRQSCAHTMRKMESENKAATVQTVSAIVAAFQVQEALKIVCNMNPSYGREYCFFGRKNQFESFPIRVDSHGCPSHLTPPRETVNETPLSHHNTLRELLIYISKAGYDTLDVSVDKERDFILTAPCPGCNKEVTVNKPFYQYFANDYFCEDCQRNNIGFNDKIYPSDLVSLNNYSLATTPDWILDKPLSELGIPAFHVLSVIDSKSSEEAFFELTEDFAAVMPEYFSKHNREAQ